eukprot:m.61389 g.61389  ORF g.61389 m.61389 type:complete len:199 (+) comp19269_c0_seq1:279-875(+)
MATLLFGFNSSGKVESLLHHPTAKTIHDTIVPPPPPHQAQEQGHALEPLSKNFDLDLDFTFMGRALVLPLRFKYEDVSRVIVAFDISNPTLVKEYAEELVSLIPNLDSKQKINLALVVEGAQSNSRDAEIVARLLQGKAKTFFHATHVFRGFTEEKFQLALNFCQDPKQSVKAITGPEGSFTAKLVGVFRDMQTRLIR